MSTIHQHGRFLLPVPAAFAVALVGWGVPSASGASARPAPDPDAGRAAYTQHCARCHGAAGAGDGLDAKRFYPRPRDLTLGIYKFRSTVSGTPPTDEDLFRTITQGLPGTNMPDWAHLDEATRWQLVEHLRSLSPFFKEVPPEPVTVSDELAPARPDLARGQAVYGQLGCAACHGGSGRANGPSAAGLIDDWGMPVRPANLTQGWSYRGGSDARAVLLRVLTGIDGSGMPSYAEAVTPEDAWHVAHYVRALQEPAHWNVITRPLVVEGALPPALDDPRWARAEQTHVRLRNVVTPAGEWAVPPTVIAVSFQAIANAEGVAFRFVWDDPTRDPPAGQGEGRQAGGQSLPDAFALLLKPANARGDVVTLQAWPYDGAPPLDICYWSADTAQAAESLAEGFAPVIARTLPQEALTSAAAYEDGRWQLVLHRALQPASPEGAAAISPGGFTAIAFAVWDAGNPGARAVSPWTDLFLRAVGTVPFGDSPSKRRVQ